MGNVCIAGSAHITHPSRPHVDSLGSSWAGQSGLSSAGRRALLPVPAETSHPAQASTLPRLPPSCNHASSSLSLPRQTVSWLVAHLSALPEVPSLQNALSLPGAGSDHHAVVPHPCQSVLHLAATMIPKCDLSPPY